MKKLTDKSKPRKKPEKITDKARLNWLANWSYGIMLSKSGWVIILDRDGMHLGPYETTQRRAIDAAIKAERDSRKGKG